MFRKNWPREECRPLNLQYFPKIYRSNQASRQYLKRGFHKADVCAHQALPDALLKTQRNGGTKREQAELHNRRMERLPEVTRAVW